MHGEKRWERYFIMHRLTGAELTKLIALKRGSGMRGSKTAGPASNDGAY